MLPKYNFLRKKSTIEDLKAYFTENIEGSLLSSVITELNSTMNQVGRDDMIEDELPPSHLTCPITLEVFNEPFIVSSNQTYEKTWILSHINKSGNIDPMTRTKITNGMLIPNRALQKACKAWKSLHGV